MEHGNITVLELLRSGTQGIAIAGFTPVDTQHKIYRVGDVLHWNGSAIGSSYTLPIASSGVLGGIRVGAGLAVDGSGVLSASALSNMVTTDTTQTITATKTFSSPPSMTTLVSGGELQALNTMIYCDTSSSSVFVNSIGNSVVVTGTGAGGRAQTGQIVYSIAGTVVSSTYLASFMSAHQCFGVAATTVNAKTYGFRTTLGGSSSNVLTMAQEYVDFAVEDEGQAGSVVLTSRYGLKINTPVFSPSSAYYGVYIANVPASTPTKYAIWSGNGIVRVGGSVELPSFTPASTTNALYNVSGTLYWNGAAVGGGAPGNMVTTDTTQSITGTKTFDSVLTVNNRAVFASTMSVHGSVNTILVTTNHDQSSGAAWALTAATRFKSGAGAASDAKGHTSFTTFQDSVGVASTGLNKARGFYAVAAQNDATNSSCGTYYGYSTLTGSGAGVTTFTTYASFAVDDETYSNAAFATRYGLLVKAGNVTPSTSWYGVYIEDGPASPTRFSIYTGTAPSRFGGGVELPSFTPASTTNRLYNVSGSLYWNGTPLQSRLTTTSEAPSANLSMTSSWVNRHTRIAPTTSVNVVVEPGIANVSDEIQILQENTNFFVLAAGSGVTLRCATSQTTIQPRARYSCLRLICIAANTFDVIGDFVP